MDDEQEQFPTNENQPDPGKIISPTSAYDYHKQHHSPSHPNTHQSKIAGSLLKTPKIRKNRDGLKGIISTVAIIILAPLIAFSLTSFVFQSYEVDGASMETTLQNQDRLIVLKVPRTWAKITGHTYIPHRGDVIIFNKQDLIDFGNDQKKQLVKRVIALPGERVVVKDNVMTVYNKEHPEGFQPDKTLPYGNVIVTTPGNVDVVVPDNYIFVSGDNRPNSLDSRIFGPIPAKDVVGKLSMRIFPFNKLKAF